MPVKRSASSSFSASSDAPTKRRRPADRGSRGWLFTWFFADGQEEQEIASLKDEQRLKDLKVVWLVFGREVCSSTGRRHLQGFVYFSDAKTLSAAQKALGKPGLHMDHPRATYSRQLVYCSKGLQSHEEWEELKEAGPNYGKEADVFQYGVRPKDFDECGPMGAAAARDDWSRIYAIAAEYTHAEHQECLERLAREFPKLALGFNEEKFSACVSKRHKSVVSEPAVGYWFHGGKGCGKSTFITKYFGKYGIYQKSDITRWFPNYKSEPVIRFEEVGILPQNCVSAFRSMLCNMLDVNDFSYEVKNGNGVMHPKIVVVSSNFSIEEVFGGVDPAVRRRFLEINFDNLSGGRIISDPRCIENGGVRYVDRLPHEDIACRFEAEIDAFKHRQMIVNSNVEDFN